MTQKDTVTRAIRKSIKNGYEPIPNRKVLSVTVVLQTVSASYVDFRIKGDNGAVHNLLVGLNDVIFDHSFAQGLWGENFRENLKLLAMQSTIKGRVSFIGSTRKTA